MNCTVCGTPDAASAGSYEPYLDYSCEVFDCESCGCRFVERDADIYEKLHQSEGTGYASHSSFADEVAGHFEGGDHAAIRDQLSKLPKNEFVISAIDAELGNTGRLLEIGCSRGYLTSYFIARGYDILGVDVSETAVAEAGELFGDHFCVPDSDRIKNGRPYDAIFHVGTIGCVEDPVGMTRDFLGLLRPGGILVFNAPNAELCRKLKTPWVPGTAPPDLVTLFTNSFWENQFKEMAETDVRVVKASPVESLRYFAKRLLAKPILAPPRTRLLETGGTAQASSPKRGGARGRQIAPILQRLHLLPRYPAEFGLHVTMRKLGG